MLRKPLFRHCFVRLIIPYRMIGPRNAISMGFRCASTVIHQTFYPSTCGVVEMKHLIILSFVYDVAHCLPFTPLYLDHGLQKVVSNPRPFSTRWDIFSHLYGEFTASLIRPFRIDPVANCYWTSNIIGSLEDRTQTAV